MINAIRLKNYKSFEDSGWIDIKSLNLLFGYNSSGKSSILKFFLLLKQTWDSKENSPLVFSDDSGVVDLGNYKDTVFAGDVTRSIEFLIKLDVTPSPLMTINSTLTSATLNIQLRLVFGFDNISKVVVQNCYEVSVNDKLEFSYLRSNSVTDKFIFKHYNYSSDNISMLKNQFMLYPKKFIITHLIKSLPNDLEHSIFDDVMMLTVLITDKLSDCFSQLTHIGPLRTPPKRLFRSSNNNPSYVGNNGQFTYSILHNSNHTQHELLNKVNKWLSAYNYELHLVDINQEIVEFKLLDIRSQNMISIVDAGFGISQVLPIIVELMNDDPRFSKVILIEQPEIHLHTKMQAELADLLIECIKINPNNILIVETHSENLLLRMRRNLLANKLDPSKGLDKKDLSVHYISNDGTKSSVSAVNFLDNGDLDAEDPSFNNFFADPFNELMEISKLAHSIKSRQILK